MQLALIASVIGLALVTVGGFVVANLWRRAEDAKGIAVQANEQLRVEHYQTQAARDEAMRQRQIAEAALQEVEREREKLASTEYGRSIQVAHQEWVENNVPASNI